LIAAGAAIVFVISGFQAMDVFFTSHITEVTQVIIKEQLTSAQRLMMMPAKYREFYPYGVGGI
jgi:hypothetical protein